MIEIRELSKYYGPAPALQRMTLSIGAGELVALLGPNGAGKSTLLQCILGITPFEGRIRVAGLDPRREGKRVRASIGYMPQSNGLHDDLTVSQTLRFYCAIKHAEVDSAELLLREVDLQTYERTRVRELSGGMRQRLAFAVACLGDPPILLLDEPSGSVDQASRRVMVERLRDRAAGGTTILLATHLSQDLAGVADRFVTLSEGRLTSSHTAIRGAA